MILFLALAAAAPDAACPQDDSARALVCRALAAGGEGEPGAAAERFEAAAQAFGEGPARDRALAAAGNMWIAAGRPGKAALALDRALAGAGLQAEQRGLALLDRARAAEAQNDLKTARATVEQAKASVSDDSFLWYFSAALAIREGDKAAAQGSINRALALAPADPLILFEAGHVAHFAGDPAMARDYWERAVAADSQGPSGKAAAEALALLDEPVTNGEAAAKAE